MPSIVPFQPSVRSGYIAGIRYKSGRKIYVGTHPEFAEFVSHPDHASCYPTQQLAFAAAELLADAFEIVNPSCIQLFTMEVLPS